MSAVADTVTGDDGDCRGRLPALHGLQRGFGRVRPRSGFRRVAAPVILTGLGAGLTGAPIWLPLHGVQHVALGTSTHTGAANGRDGAPRQGTAAVATRVIERLRRGQSDRRVLIVGAAGAGPTAVYNVPLTGGVHTLEIRFVTRRWRVALRHRPRCRARAV